MVAVAVVVNAVTLSPLVPWQSWRLWSEPAPAQEFFITVKDYTFHLPSEKMYVDVGEPVKFTVTSEDVTYGFGVFREDGSMVFQMQVLPGYNNSIVWVFDQPGSYTIRSTEYSGPNNYLMVVQGAIVVR